MTTPSRSTRPQVLFVGADASSPQIAASVMRREVGEAIGVETARTRPADPGGRSDEMLVAMGLDPADDPRLSSVALHKADRVVILGADLDVARMPGPRYEVWDLAQSDLVDQVETLGQDLIAGPSAPARLSVLARIRAWLRAALR